MCAPLVAPCEASYMEVFTCISCTVSGLGVGKALPIASYTEVLVCTPPGLFAVKFSPVLGTTRPEATWLVLLPLNRFPVSMPFNWKVLSRSEEHTSELQSRFD